MAFMEFYKKGQGSLARLMGTVAFGALVAWGGFKLNVQLEDFLSLSRPLFVIPQLGTEVNLALLISIGVVALGWVFIVWLLNRARMVDLLVETESEMRKVSWPSRQEAWNSSVIVVITVLFMMGLLFFYDVFLNAVLKLIYLSEGI